MLGAAPYPGIEPGRLLDLLRNAGGFEDPDRRRDAYLPRGEIWRIVGRGDRVERELLRFDLGAALGGDPRWSLPAMYVPHPGGRDYVLALGDQTRIALALALIAIGLAVAARFTTRLAAAARPADRAAAWSAVAGRGDQI